MPINVLMVAHFSERSGWGQASVNMAECLNSNPEINLICRDLPVGKKDVWSELVKSLCNKPLDGIEYCLQLLLPHHMEYAPFKKCVGMFFNETSDYIYTSWPTTLNLLDEIWIPYPSEAHTLSGIRNKVRVINPPVDINKYTQNVDKLDLPVNGSYTFYYIGEFNKRKNLPLLIRAFHEEFGHHEPVSLVIKTNEPGKSQQETAESIINVCNTIKAGLKLRKRYHNEIIITEYLSEEDMARLHTTCDCFVMPSRGEAICLPLLDAIGYGKHVITSNSTSMSYIMTQVGYKPTDLINGRDTTVFGMTDTFDDLFTSNEHWYEPDIFSLRDLMRRAYQNNLSGSSVGFRQIFNYNTVSNQVIKAFLDN